MILGEESTRCASAYDDKPLRYIDAARAKPIHTPANYYQRARRLAIADMIDITPEERYLFA